MSISMINMYKQMKMRNRKIDYPHSDWLIKG